MDRERTYTISQILSSYLYDEDDKDLTNYFYTSKLPYMLMSAIRYNKNPVEAISNIISDLLNNIDKLIEKESIISYDENLKMLSDIISAPFMISDRYEKLNMFNLDTIDYVYNNKGEIGIHNLHYADNLYNPNSISYLNKYISDEDLCEVIFISIIDYISQQDDIYRYIRSISNINIYPIFIDMAKKLHRNINRKHTLLAYTSTYYKCFNINITDYIDKYIEDEDRKQSCLRLISRIIRFSSRSRRFHINEQSLYNLSDSQLTLFTYMMEELSTTDNNNTIIKTLMDSFSISNMDNVGDQLAAWSLVMNVLSSIDTDINMDEIRSEGISIISIKYANNPIFKNIF